MPSTGPGRLPKQAGPEAGAGGARGIGALTMIRKTLDDLADLETGHPRGVAMLVAAVEARDPYAGHHLHHIRAYTEALATNLDLTYGTVERIGYASLLHDLGKLVVPDAIITKRGPLDEEEWAVIRQHPLVGECLLGSGAFYETARAVARWHHERWGGGGYPDGLKGEEIPLAARIVSVANVLDALTSRRPYKEAWPLDRAVGEIERVRGGQLDPRVVGELLNLYRSGSLEQTVLGPPKRAAA